MSLSQSGSSSSPPMSDVDEEVEVLEDNGEENGVQMMMLRWLNPESIKIYARASVVEKIHWVDEIAKVKAINAARTTTIDNLAATNTMAAWRRRTRRAS